MARSNYLLKENTDEETRERLRQKFDKKHRGGRGSTRYTVEREKTEGKKRSDYLLKHPLTEKTVPIKFADGETRNVQQSAFDKIRKETASPSPQRVMRDFAFAKDFTENYGARLQAKKAKEELAEEKKYAGFDVSANKERLEDSEYWTGRIAESRSAGRGFEGDRKVRSEWETLRDDIAKAEAVQARISERKARDEENKILTGYNIAAAEARREQIKRELSDANKDMYSQKGEYGRNKRMGKSSDNTEYEKAKKAEEALRRELADIDHMIPRARKAQLGAKYAAIPEQPDFEAYGKTADGTYKTYIGDIEDATKYMPLMTEEEKQTHEYLKNKEGSAAAIEYINWLKPQLEAKRGRKTGDMLMEDYGPTVRTLYRAAAGVENWGRSVGQVLTDKEIPMSETGYANEYLSQNTDGVERVVGDVAFGMGNLAPSVAAATLNPALGKIAFGMGAYGGYYNSALREGKSKEEARSYAALSTASELTLEHLLGGIGKLGGKKSLTSVLSKLSKNIDGAVAKFAYNVTSHMGSEFIEEYSQNIMDTALRNAVFGENNEIKLVSEEALYDGMIGALTALGMEAPGIAVNTYVDNAIEREMYREKVNELKRAGAVLSPEAYYAAEAAGHNDAGRDPALARASGSTALRSAQGDTGVDVPAAEAAENSPYDEKKVSADFLEAVDNELLDYVGKVEAKEKETPNSYTFGQTTERMNKDIKRLTGIDTTSFRHSIGRNSIRHIFKRHGKNGNADRSMANNKDIARIGYVLENYEEIELLDNESKEFRNKNQKPAPMVRMSKRVDGTFYVVEAVPDTKAKKLAVVSAYIEKPLRQTRDVQAPLWNVRNASADNGSMDSIAENEPIVNKNAPGAENTPFGESGSKAIRAVLPNPTPEQYRAFAQVYNISAEGRMQSADSEGVLESARAVLSPEAYYAAEAAGHNDAGRDPALARASGSTALRSAQGDTGVDVRGAGEVVRDEYYKRARLTSLEGRILDALARITGVRIRFVETIKNGEKSDNAQYSDGEIRIALDSDDPVRVAVVHEVIHRLREIAPESYRKLADFVFNNLTEDELELLRKDFGAGYRELSPDGVSEEIVAQAFGVIMGDRNRLDALIEDDRGTWEKICDIINDLIISIRRALSGKAAQISVYDREAFSGLLKKAEEMERVLREALDASQMQNAEGKVQNEILRDAQDDTGARDPALARASGSTALRSAQGDTGADARAEKSTAGAVKSGNVNKADLKDGGNSRLTDADMPEYIRTGRRQHTRDEKARLINEGKSPILRSKDDIKRFITDSITGKTTGEVRAYGKVGGRFARDVKAIDADTDIYGKYLELTSDKLKHAYDRHAKSAQNGNIDLTETDFQNIADYIDNYDYVLSVEEHNKAKKIRIAKKINGYTVILSLVSKERNSLHPINMIGMSTEFFEQKYMKKEKSVGSREETTTKAESPSLLNAVTHTGHTLSETNIPQTRGKSNRQNMLKTEDLLSPEYGSGDSSAEPQNDTGARDPALARASGSTALRSAQGDTGADARAEKSTAGAVKSSVKRLRDGRKYVQADRQVIFGNDPESWSEQLEDYINGKIRRGKNVELIAEDGEVLTLTADTAGKVSSMFNNDGTTMSETAFERKVNAGSHIDELAQVSVGNGKIKKDSGQKHGEKATGGWKYRTAYFKDFDGKYYQCTISVMIGTEGNAVYNIGQMQERSFPGVNGSSAVNSGAQVETSITNGDQDSGSSVNNDGALSGKTSFDNSISESEENVNTKSSRKRNEEERGRIYELERENKKQKKLIEQLRERMRGLDKKVIRGKVDERAARKATRELIQRYGGEINPRELAPELLELWDGIGTGKNLDWTDIHAKAKDIARRIAESSIERDDTMYRDFAELRRYCRENTFTISESDRSNIPDFNDFRKRNTGRMRIAYGKTDIDVHYIHLAEMYPGMFDGEREMHPAAQLEHIAEVLNDVYDITERSRFESHMDYAVGTIANDILETFYEIPETKKTLKDLKIEKLTKSVVEKTNSERNVKKELEQYKKTAEREAEKLMRAYNKEQLRRAKDKEKYRENKSKIYEEQRKREVRGKIIRSFDRLAHLATRPTDKRHIPESLKSAVTGFLGCINFNNEWAIDAKTGHVVKRLPPEMERRELLPTKKSVKYAEMRAQFKEAAQEITFADDFFEASEDGKSGNLLLKVKELSDTPIYDMSEEELRDVYTAMRIVEKAIRHGNEMFATGVAATRADTAYAILREAEPKERKFDFGHITTYNFRPYTFFHALGETGDRLFRALREAQDKRTLLIREIRKFNRKNLAGIDTGALEKEKKRVTLGGKEVEITTAQLMELYLLSRREQAKKHIFGGGIVLKSRENIKDKIESKRTRSISVTEEEVGRAIEALTPEQKQIAEKISAYVTDYIGGMMDEECLKVFGYKKFGEKNYWPIEVDPDGLKSDKKNAGEGEVVRRIGSYGMAHATSPTATTAIRVKSIFDTYAGHCAQAANYAAFLGVSEDMYHIGNFSFSGAEGDNPKNMNDVLAGVFGQSGVRYWKKLDADISAGNARFGNEKNPLAGLTNISKAKAVSLNFRVWMQQYSAILRAGQEMNYAYIAAGAPTALAGWKKALKYSPIAMWKSWGFYDANTGPTMRSLILGDDGALEKIRSGAMAPAGWMDSLGWGTIWNACELETKARLAKEKRDVLSGSAEFYAEVKARFEEIIDRTQVVDGVLQRSHNMRSKNELVNMSTSYMSEPTTQVNEIFCAAIDIKRAKTETEKRRAGIRLARTGLALLISLTANALFGQSPVDAWREDEEKEKKYMERVGDKFIGDYSEAESAADRWRIFFMDSNLGENLNPLSYFPFAKDVVSLVKGFEPKRMDMTLISEMVSVFTNISRVMNGESKYTAAEVSLQGFATLAGFLGLGVGNLKKDVRGVLLSMAGGNVFFEYRLEKAVLNISYDQNAKVFYDILYRAKEKDKEAYELIYADMVKSGMDEKKIMSAMEDRMKKAAGVKEVSELEERYLSPEKQKAYNATLSPLKSTEIWKAASSAQRKDLEGDVYNLTVLNDAGKKLRDKMDAAAKYGIDTKEYLLYLLACDVVDTQNKSGKLGGAPTSKEFKEATALVGLSKEEKDYLWEQLHPGK